MTFAKVLAPFMPFLTETCTSGWPAGRCRSRPIACISVRLPTGSARADRPALEEAVSRMQQVILLGRQRREEVKINLRKPMRRLTIVHRDADLLNELRVARGVHPARVERQGSGIRPGRGQLHPAVCEAEFSGAWQTARQADEGVRCANRAADARSDRIVAGNRLDHYRRRNVRHRGNTDPARSEAGQRTHCRIDTSRSTSTARSTTTSSPKVSRARR